MSVIAISIDASDIVRIGNLLAAAGDKAPLGIRRALKHAGDKARTKMRRATTAQTRLKYGVLVRAIQGRMEGGAYVIRSRGGNVRLKFYGPRETRKGVSHRSPKRGSPISGAFKHGGRFPNRRGGPGGGRGVYSRAGAGRFPLRTERSNVWIPEEMVTGGSAASFFATARAELPDRMAHELLRILGG